MIPKYLFVGEDLKVHTGNEAKSRIAMSNDKSFFEDGKGVVTVPKSRWILAQSYESRTWSEIGEHADDDRNWEHAHNFGEYKVIKNVNFKRAIELGCGPFTNLRVVARYSNIASCVLLDPLIDSYKRHRNCVYRHGKVKVEDSKLNRKLESSRLKRAARRLLRWAYPGCLEKGVLIEASLRSPIEEIPECGRFDLVVMVNVIEHCFDLQKIFENVLSLCKPGTVFVFHDRLYDAKEVAESSNFRFDAGHPLRVDRSQIFEFLSNNFSTMMQKQVEVADSIGDISLNEQGIYFIGRRN